MPDVGAVPGYSSWDSKTIEERSELLTCAQRVAEMTGPSTMGGIQPGQHANTTQTNLNNLRSVDWAIWKLLLALKVDFPQKSPPDEDFPH